MMIEKDLINFFEEVFTKAETVLDPFISLLKTQLTPQLLALAATTVASVEAAPTSLNNMSEIKALAATLMGKVENLTEQDAINAVQVTVTSMIAKQQAAAAAAANAAAATTPAA